MSEKLSDKLRDDLLNVLSLAHCSLRRCELAQRIITHGFDGTHHADITIRANGQDYHCEADWARHALRLLRRLAVETGITEVKTWQEDGTFQLYPWPPASENQP
jgi:hypothetical protein